MNIDVELDAKGLICPLPLLKLRQQLNQMHSGPVVRVESGPGGSCLVVLGLHGEILVPLAAPICVEVDLGSRRVRVDPPEGLLELNETKRVSGRRGTAE